MYSDSSEAGRGLPHDAGEARDAYALSRREPAIVLAMQEVPARNPNGLPPLGDRCGRGAIFRFLRLSLRLEALPASLEGRTKADELPLLGNPPSERLMGKLLGLGDDSRNIVNTLERGGRATYWTGRFDVLLRVYFGHGDGSPAAEGQTPVLVRHANPMPPSKARECLEAALRANDQLRVADFAARHFDAPAFNRAVLIATEPELRPQSQVLPSSPVTSGAAVQEPRPRSARVVALDSLRLLRTDGRVHVPVNLLPTRHAQMEALMHATRRRVPGPHAPPPHGIVVVSGPIGIGKSGLIQEWLLQLREAANRPFDELLYVTDASREAEDVLVAQVRDYLASSVPWPLLVLDGLRIDSGELVWMPNARRQPSASDLSLFLASQVGLRSFVAVLGIQTSPVHPSGVPTRLKTHPNYPQIAITEEIRLQPLPLKEARHFASEVMASRSIREADLDGIAAWSGGLPLLLGAASTLPDDGVDALHLPLTAPADAADRSSQMWAQLREALQMLNQLDGGHHAVMRLLSLFRRSQPYALLSAVVAGVQRTGLDIKRISEDVLRNHVTRSPFFSQGSEGRVELHDGVAVIIRQDLAHALRTDREMDREVQVINLVASRLFYQRLHARGRLQPRDDEAAEPGMPATQHDLELICDCAHHLLGSRRTAPVPAAPLAWHDEVWARGLDERIAHVFSGVASAEEIEQFCYRRLLGRTLIEGHVFSDRGLFAHKLALLNRFTEGWSHEPTGRSMTDPIRRKVRLELGACSIVAGRLNAAQQPLQQVLDELSRTTAPMAIPFGRAGYAGKRQQPWDAAVSHCVETVRASATLATAQLRMGAIRSTRERLERTVREVVEPTEALLRQRVQPQQEDLIRDQISQVQLAHARLLVRIAEAAYLGTSTVVSGRSPGLAEPLALFERAHQLHEAQAQRRFLFRSDEVLSRSTVHPAGGLSGESARSRIRCLLAAAQITGRRSVAGQSYLHLANELVERHFTDTPNGWSNDAIGFGLLKSTVALLDGRFQDAQAALLEIDRNDKYRNLGACSQAVKFEIRLAHAKVELARSRTMSPVSCDDLVELVQHAGQTRHQLPRLDALLLLAIGSAPLAAAQYLQQARALSEAYPEVRARDDVFAWLESGRQSPWLELTLTV